MKRSVIALIACAIGIASVAFQAGRTSVGSVASSAATQVPANSAKSKVASAALENDFHKVLIQNVATVSFSELYDLLKAAPREQVLEWAAALDRLPWSAKRSGALKAFYKALIQADVGLACDALTHTRTTSARELAADAINSAAPESSWGEIAKTMFALEPNKTRPIDYELIWNWSAVDPKGASEFVEQHRENSSDSVDDSLVSNWAGIDFPAARAWVEADQSRQTSGALTGLIYRWYDLDRSGAANYLIAHQDQAKFAEALHGFATTLVNDQPAEARSFIMSLSADAAKTTMESIVGEATAVVIGAGRDYQQHPDKVAEWMVTLPPEFWQDRIGSAIGTWAFDHRADAVAWMNQLPEGQRNTAIAAFCSNGYGDFPVSDERLRSDLPETLGLAFSISNPEVRDLALRSLMQKLEGADVETPVDIESLNIPRAQKHVLYRLRHK